LQSEKGAYNDCFHYTVSIPVFIQQLNGLNTLLDKAAAWAAARKVNEADLLNMRLSPDMFNLVRQVRAATDHAANAAGRLSCKELLKLANDGTTIAQLKDRIAKTIDFLKSIKQSEIDGTETKDISITFPSGQTRQFRGQSLLLGNSLPNSYSTPQRPTTSFANVGGDRKARFHGPTAVLRQRPRPSETGNRRESRQVHGEAFEIGERTVD
jgi:hypothetical protein